jgi:broad specificity phosphatase PhoE
MSYLPLFSVDNFLSFLLLICVYYWIQFTRDDENMLTKQILRKCSIYCDAFIFMVLSKDTKSLGPKKNPDPDTIFKGKDKLPKKTLIFIRHGESDWNDVFNKGINLGMITRLGKALYQEFQYFTTQHSIFIDSPLNMEGFLQAADLAKYVQSLDSAAGQSEDVVDLLDTLRGHSSRSSVIVSSQLRRAVATTTVALWPRVHKTHEKIHILSSLQEISRNVDTYAVSPPKAIADLPFDRLRPFCSPEEPFQHEIVYETTENFGNKTRSFYGLKRLKAFNEWIFARKEDVIIVGGHSLWFRYFFQTFLPHSIDHPSKKQKITNSGVIAFDLYYYFNEQDGEKYYRVEPTSMKTVYGGYTSK